MEQKQVQNQWIPLPAEDDEDEEEMTDTIALEGKIPPHHKKYTTFSTGVTPPSSSSSFSSTSPISNGHSNGVSSGSVEEPLILKEEEKETPIQKDEEVEEIGNVVETGNHESEAIGLGIVAEFVGDAINGEAIHCNTATIDVAAFQNSSAVYFDKQQGMWKCHHCSWTKRIDSSWNVPQYDDLPMNHKTMIQYGPCFFCEIKGNEVNALEGVKNGDGERSVLPESNGEGESEIQVENSDIQNGLLNEVNQNDKVHSTSEISPLHNSSKVQVTTSEAIGDETSAKAIPNLTKEIDQQLEDLNVEAVLAKQETHDLFCPNCNSCITKRVILRKRKRNIPKLDTETKPDKSDAKRISSSSAHDVNQGGNASTISDAGSQLAHDANQDGRATGISDAGSLLAPAGNYEPETEPEVFRCSTCLSFFIALRNGLFPCFADAREPETSQPLIIPASNLENPSNVAAPNANWFTSLFTSKGKKAREHAVDAASVENSRAGSSEPHNPSSTAANMQTTKGNDHPEGPLADRAISNNVKLAPDNKPEHGVNSPNPSSVKLVTTEAGKENDIKSRISPGGEPLDDQKRLKSSIQNNLSSIQPSTHSFSDVMNESQKVGVDFIDSSAKEPFLTENVKTDVGEKKNDSVDMIKTDMPSMNFPGDMASKSNNVPSATAAITEGSLIHRKSLKGVDKSPEISQNGYSSLVQEAQSPAQAYGSAVVASDTGALKSSTPQTADNVPVQSTVTEPHTQIDIEEQPRAEIGEPPLKLEILKSIVYGGLLESITSLGIVSSAAGSGAVPLNIVAMGFANLIGGLFIIFHNLIELRNDHSGGDLHQTNFMQEDRYQAQLGRRANFLLHVVVAILSFLIFGAVPIIVYGLLIHKNYSAELKLAIMAVTSITCIILLATGKVYTKGPPKSYTTTLLQYVTLALAASGVSYIAGGLIHNLLENFNGPESGFALTIPTTGTRSTVKPAWVPY
ncbi:PREDICTED: membrane protein of ER body-like protein isoform X2 [Lupinus angustifolius]|uniref:membrane protein of ER body-like protein isoform X2 n=1 Tax=Lupinus angustifolius TaxID=3871 RepID=UPI00092F7CD0|nr:PREDICTED: membrane protein of ER body-like protein isoform X2 [Lupinus angustifolius]